MVGIFPSLDIAKLVIRVPGSRASLGPRNDSRENRSSEQQHLSAADLAADRVLLLVVMAVAGSEAGTDGVEIKSTQLPRRVGHANSDA